MHGESSARDTSERGDNRIHIFEKMREDSKTPEYTKIAENDTSVGLNLSPITQASCVDSPGGISNASGSPFSIHTSGENCNAKFRPFSTPTEGLDAKENGSYNNNAEGSFLGETYGKKPVDFTQDIQSQHHYFKPIAVCKSEMKASHDCGDVGRACLEQEETTLATKCEDEICGGISSCSSQEGDSQTQVRYTWLTRHMSCDECHSSFGHVVKLAKEAAETGIVVDMKGSKKTEKKSTNISSLRQINKKHCIMSPVPSSLPLVCPGQHLHKLFGNNIYDDGKNPVEDPTTFSFGRLKVLLIDGVIFRIVRLQSMKCIEVYPGDGSVIASQGMTGHFFQHIIPIGNKLEERTYSLKSPPGQAVVGGHSIKGLLNRANRFLAHVRQEENMPSSLGLCCWKHEDVILTEPGTTTTLEECEIPGYDIVDKTVLKSDMLENPKGASSQFVPSNKPGPGILRNTDQVRAKESRAGNFPPRTVQIHSPNASQSSSISTESSSKHSLLEKHIPSAGYSESGMTNSETFFHRNVRPVPIGQDNSDNRMSELDGFNSVRQALMKTSNFIKDIDHLLDTK
ncbi:CE034-like protein [Mya arenaria]|uniref:CE034-like protein n=1 Tax=Mya arenaria TaxID=6604 RepID=A0ABY7GA27_MYAAR|nr:CE034-like protein [Mya arenaria]